jgi:ethanolamine ammonia-lyase small subunit
MSIDPELPELPELPRAAGAAGAAGPARAGPPPAGGVIADPWDGWRSATPARIALGRAGAATPTAEALRFGWAHAMARDTIHAPLDADALAGSLREAGWEVLRARSRADDRSAYLHRPDLGRQLHPEDAERLRGARHGAAAPALCIVIGDGLSSLAAQRHAVPLLAALRERLRDDPPIGPVVVATQARVALADDIGEALGARAVAMLLGERPGLSAPDSLGIYLTHAPRRGRHDAERNCISNVRPEGLAYDTAARQLAWLVRQALRRGLTGVGLKDESDADLLEAGDAPAIPSPPPA